MVGLYFGKHKGHSQPLHVKSSTELNDRKQRTTTTKIHIDVSSHAHFHLSVNQNDNPCFMDKPFPLHSPKQTLPSLPAAPRWRYYSPKLPDSLALPRLNLLVSLSSRANSNNMLQASAVVVWEWLNEHGRWRPYSPAVSHQIEAAIRSSDPRGGSVVLGQVDSRLSPYIIDLQSMHQFRQDTGK